MDDLQSLSQEDLAAKAWHELPVARLIRLADPLSAWAEQSSPITREEVQACLARGGAALVDTPIWHDLANEGVSAEENRTRHIQKIAWFMENEATHPISIDVGMRGGDVEMRHLVEDGNHRLAAALLRGDATIRAHVGGSVRVARKLGLWHPNPAEQESWRRFEATRLPPRKPTRPR